MNGFHAPTRLLSISKLHSPFDWLMTGFDEARLSAGEVKTASTQATLLFMAGGALNDQDDRE
jgi:hypothetical protein